MTDPLQPTGIERSLAALTPAAPSVALMTRLRAARPASQAPATRTAVAQPPASRARRQPAYLTAAALAFLAALVWLSRSSSPQPARAASPASPGLASVSPATTDRPGIRESAAAFTTPIFLPVESSRRLVSVQPVPMESRPDEAPRRLMRAVFVDDLTAVGAHTDDVLHLRRTREVYLPVSNPIY